MKVKQSSWHFKAWKLMQIPPIKAPTVCSYCGQLLLLPFFCALIVIISPVIPLVWIGDKIETKFKGKTICPFGKVEIEP